MSFIIPSSYARNFSMISLHKLLPHSTLPPTGPAPRGTESGPLATFSLMTLLAQLQPEVSPTSLRRGRCRKRLKYPGQHPGTGTGGGGGRDAGRGPGRRPATSGGRRGRGGRTPRWSKRFEKRGRCDSSTREPALYRAAAPSCSGHCQASRVPLSHSLATLVSQCPVPVLPACSSAGMAAERVGNPPSPCRLLGSP